MYRKSQRRELHKQDSRELVHVNEAVNQCLKEEALAMRGMLILMGFPQDATIIEEDRLTRGMKHLDLAR